MNITGHDVFVAIMFLVIGWVLHMLWDEIMGWIEDITGSVGGLVWHLCAVIGIVTVCVVVGYVVVHGTHGT